jgi:phosphoglycolate phosphatase-like HAD superfamily hydrolase
METIPPILRRYQVFISSPYAGLEDARNAVIDAVLRFDWSPAAMEFFPASAKSSWESIKQRIESSDYFLTLLGGRAGTLHPSTRVPITEMEYDYACAKGIPVARFVHGSPETLEPDARDTDEHRAAFARFRTKLLAFGNQTAIWKDREDLIRQLSPALKLFLETPRPGWVRTPAVHAVESMSRLGISDVYPTRDAARERILDDIRTSTRGCWLSSSVYVELVRNQHHEDFIEALAAAHTHGAHDYQLTFCSLSPDCDGLAGPNNQAVLECWRRREGDRKIESLQARISRGSSMFETLAATLGERVPTVRAERRYFRDYLVPHSLVVIDYSIAYVSLYDWATPSGAQAFTVRFEGGQADRFVREVERIRTSNSYRHYKVLAFDFDGVIADSMDLHVEAWCRAIRRAKLASSAGKRLLANVWAGAAGSAVFDGVELPDRVRDRLRATKDEHFAKLAPTPFSGVEAGIDRLKRTGRYKLALATTAQRPYLESYLERMKLRGVFDCIKAAGDVPRSKPYPDLLTAISQELDCQPWEMCVIGDSNADYCMSQAARTDFILFESHPQHGVPDHCRRATTWPVLVSRIIGALD